MKKKPVIIAGAVTLAVLAAYFGGVAYFSKHYLFRTQIGSVECGCKTPEYVVERYSETASDYMLTVTDRLGNLFPIVGADIDYAYVPKGEEEAILEEQNPFDWFGALFKTSYYDISTSTSYDLDKAKSRVAALGIFDEDYIAEPIDASIQLTSDGYEIIPEDEGNEPVYDKVLPQILSALDQQSDRVTLSDDSYTKPQILQDDSRILAVAATIDAYTAAEITYEIGDEREELSSEKILSLLSIGEDYSVSVDQDALLAFVQTLCTKYNTYADVRSFVTSAGDTIQIGGGDYGWVISKKGEMAQIEADLAAGEPVTREPIYEQTAAQHGADDIGNTYIEIDYTNQHLWYYEEGTLVCETDIVSGNLSKQNGSVDGVFSISYKKKDATLVGEDYSSSVKYFMPFAYNIGIHDASWRSKFGGEIYKTSGSHGCVNVPYEAAETLYSLVSVDTPVVAYYREPVELTNNAAKVSNAYSYVEPEEESAENEEVVDEEDAAQ